MFSNIEEVPYVQFSNTETIEKVLAGYRLTPPSNCPSRIANLMKNCWNTDPSTRPSFKVLFTLSCWKLKWLIKEICQDLEAEDKQLRAHASQAMKPVMTALPLNVPTDYNV
jgi:hypothetical protein